MSDSLSAPTLRRVLALSLMDGRCMTLLSGFCTSVSLLTGEWTGACVGAIVMSSGITTLRSRKRLMGGDGGGMVWLFRAQLVVLAIVFLYVLGNLLTYDAAVMNQRLLDIQTDSFVGGILFYLLDQYSISVADLESQMKPLYFGIYLLVMTGTLLFQGGLALFYKTRRRQVTAELAAREVAELSSPVKPTGASI